MAVPFISKIAVRLPRVGTLPGQANFGTNKLATEAVVKAVGSLSPASIHAMPTSQLATTLKNVNASFMSHLGQRAELMRDSSHALVDTVEGSHQARPVLNALEFRRAQLITEIERTDAPGGHDTKMLTLMSSQHLSQFHWDTLGSQVHHAGEPLSRAFSFDSKTDPQFLGIKARLGQLKLTADHNSSYPGGIELARQLRPLVDELSTFIAPFKAGWASPSPAKTALEQLRAVRDQLKQTLNLLEQHTALIAARPPSFFD